MDLHDLDRDHVSAVVGKDIGLLPVSTRGNSK